TVKFFIFTFLGSLLMLAAIIALYYISAKANSGVGTFDYVSLINLMKLGHLSFTGPLANTGFLLFMAFALAFSIKVPIFPFHTWLPDAHVEAPTPGSVILAGVLLKMGTYGFLRFALPILPEGTKHFFPVMVVGA